MAYTKVNFTDRVVEFPNRYTDQNANQYTFTRDEGTVTDTGTPLTSGNLNQMDEGIYNNSVDIGDTSTLTTTSKEVVGAINELDTDKLENTGDTATGDYTFNDKVIVGEIEGKNLFNKYNYSDEKFLNASGVYGESSGNYAVIIKIEGGNDITVSKDSSSRCRMATFSEYPYTGVTTIDYVVDDTATEKTLTTSATAEYLMVQFGTTSDDPITDLLDSIQIEYGSTATDYYEYQNFNNTFRGCLLYKTANQTLANDTGYYVTFEAEEYDTDNFHDNTTNNTRITIPSGISKVKLTASIGFAVGTIGLRYIAVRKNGSDITGGGRNIIAGTTAGNLGANYINCVTAVLNVVEGDYFELRTFQNSGGNLDITGTTATSTFFSLEVIE